MEIWTIKGKLFSGNINSKKFLKKSVCFMALNIL